MTRRYLTTLALAVVTSLFVMTMKAPEAQARTWPESCPRLTGTFIQPLAAHATWTASDWSALMSELHAVGVETLYLQWTQLDQFNIFEEGSRVDLSDPIIVRILEAAEEYNIRLWLGLVFDPNYWSRIAEEASLVEVYLRRHRVSNYELVTRLHESVADSPSFGGWYITEEIDDLTWQDVTKRNLLFQHLAATVADIRTITPETPIAISGFTGARMDPAALADFWFDLLDTSGINIMMMQDGFGVHQGAIPPDSLALYMQSVKHAAEAAGARFDTIVEVFTQISGPPINNEAYGFVPAEFSRIPEQLALAKQYSTNRIAFSMPEYMSSGGPPSAGALYCSYVLWLLDQCGPGS